MQTNWSNDCIHVTFWLSESKMGKLLAGKMMGIKVRRKPRKRRKLSHNQRVRK